MVGAVGDDGNASDPMVAVVDDDTYAKAVTNAMKPGGPLATKRSDEHPLSRKTIVNKQNTDGHGARNVS